MENNISLFGFSIRQFRSNINRQLAVFFVLSGLVLGSFVFLFNVVCSASVFADVGQSAFTVEQLQTDWLYQDFGLDTDKCFTSADNNNAETKITDKVVSDLERLGLVEDAKSFRLKSRELRERAVVGKDPLWKSLYLDAAQLRRVKRLEKLPQNFRQLVYTKHCILGSSHYAYTEDVTDAQTPERNKYNRDWRSGAALCRLTINPDASAVSEVLCETKTGIIRDPDVSYNADKILFSMRQNITTDEYHLYEYDLKTKQISQLTDGNGFADIEPCYLPDGNIMFASTRCMQIVDCWWTDVCNFYMIDGEGRFMRRIGFDQVHTNYPTTTDDGLVLYTRWDYNDRGHLYPQPLFQMNYDGTAQTEFYGNNSWFPTTILHARKIPNSPKVIAVASGHHTHQRGKLILIDRSQGTQEAEGVRLIAPVRKTDAVKIDQYGQDGDQFQYPYPIDETHFFVTYSPRGFHGNNYNSTFGIYFMDVDGNRELLAFDASISCNQQVPIVKRTVPVLRSSSVDYTKETGQFYVQDVYEGRGLRGVERGTVKSIRVVALEFRAAGIGRNSNKGLAGSALVSTPVGYNNCSWDVKRVLGNVPVESDGSAYFEVPARTPVYFQMLDAKGRVVQTMRSWSTLQPNELFSCIGCHENKNEAPLNNSPVSKLALRKMPTKPVPLVNVDRGFSFPLDVQPILDKHCVGCHDGSGRSLADGSVAKLSLLGKPYKSRPNDQFVQAGRAFSESYLNLINFGEANKLVNWVSVQSVPSMLPPNSAGSVKSELMTQLYAGHRGVRLTAKELEVMACWIDLAVPFCGSYTEANIWNKNQKAEYAYYQNKRDLMAEIEKDNIKRYIEFKKTTIKPDRNTFRSFNAGGIESKKKWLASYNENNNNNK
ncbi:MAG: hypothetical protein LBQ66_12745 [Planctomycetaceae bacterium]|jgi:hypothetical protein|nr:hypothetical protein [Planctomycetaceae bacterium]